MFWLLPLPPVPALTVAAAGPHLDVALNADEAEADRVLAFHRLRGLERLDDVDQRRTVARRLIAVLNEPLLWLGAEAHACLCALDDSLAVGVNERGLLAASPEGESALQRDADGQRHCPVLGAVEALPHAGALLPRLAAPPPWLAAPPHGGVLFAVDDAGGFLRKVWVQVGCTLGAGSFTVRLPGKAKVSVELLLREGSAAIQQGYAGPGPTLNAGPRLGKAWQPIHVGDVIGMDPWRLRVLAVVPPSVHDGAGPTADDVVTLDDGGTLPRMPRTGAAVSWPERFAGHVVHLGEGRLAIVDLDEGTARTVQVGARTIVVERPLLGWQLRATWVRARGRNTKGTAEPPDR